MISLVTQAPTVAARHQQLPYAGPEVDPYDPEVVADRVEAGRRAETTADVPEDFGPKAAPAYFRTYEQVEAALYDLQAKYPNLVEVRDIGDSAEKVAGAADRDILALVLTNKAKTGVKPSTLHVAGIHAREIANPELLMKFAGNLLTGYGTDAEATMLLDSRETVLVPMLNPDGHAVVERGFAGEKGGYTMQRKSTMNGDPAKGTDLNRNYEYHWGGPGAGTNPGSETYRGPGAASEPETQAIQKYVAAHKPSFFMDWHSYSQLNMYPWGDTKEHTKD
ncbi:MAG: Carboxypeptidase, partial [Thermoleophilia bacterium]|nr:Carboxypeptidase [Thermoleophilia bacterium]